MATESKLRINPHLSTILQFGEQTAFDSKGRNGFVFTTGVEISSVRHSNTVFLFPINSRGQVSEACRLAIHRDAIDDLITALKVAKERT